MTYYMEKCPKCGKLRPTLPPEEDWTHITPGDSYTSNCECKKEKKVKT